MLFNKRGAYTLHNPIENEKPITSISIEDFCFQEDIVPQKDALIGWLNDDGKFIKCNYGEHYNVLQTYNGLNNAVHISPENITNETSLTKKQKDFFVKNRAKLTVEQLQDLVRILGK